MGIKIMEETTKIPLQLIGKAAGICWGANTEDKDKNIKRAWSCINSGHGRTEEFPDVYCVIEKYSAKCMREIYTHIGGLPTRLQASTRYIDYEKGFETIIPTSVKNNPEATAVWNKAIEEIHKNMTSLKELGIPKEDYTNLLPLAYESKMVWKINLRTLINFMNQRLCTRAYWEMRNFANELKTALSNYSEEWAEISQKLFVPKCEAVGYCIENQCCGRKPKKCCT
jgi:thymidylate synthase (FAD)